MNKENENLTVKNINDEIGKVNRVITQLNDVLVKKDSEYSQARRRWLFEQTSRWLNSYIRELEDYSVVPS